jgi:hypothetical protein
VRANVLKQSFVLDEGSHRVEVGPGSGFKCLFKKGYWR